MTPKIVAFYLPQFHEIRENSEWYGAGFTDWVAVKNAKPLFPGHRQPKEPLNQNYYDLTNAETIKWQAKIAREYGVDGFCFYHYWFDSDTRLLEKPAEILLQHQDIDISYCFSWANESWKRTWSNIEKGNVWCDAFDYKQKNYGNGLLAKQRYGREEEWQKHIEYLLPFFCDKRYLKIDGKPVFVVYQPCDIFCIKAMLEFWKDKMAEYGINGLYLIGASYGKMYSKNMDINYNHEPGTAFALCREQAKYTKSPEGIEFFDYDIVWRQILDQIEENKLPCAFTGFDASPRKGYKGVIVKESTPKKFEYYFGKLLEKSIQNKAPLLFINAWNEWGEGMNLEPSEENGYQYLEAIQATVQAVNNKRENVAEWKEVETEKHLRNNRKKEEIIVSKETWHVTILCQWLSASRLGLRVESFFEKYGYRTIAIYGMGILGKQLLEELRGSRHKVLYYIDQRDIMGEGMPEKVPLNQKLPDVDCIVVTAVMEFEKIYERLKEKSTASIINICEIFDDLF